MNVPASQQPSSGNTPIVNEPTIVRMGSIPHGVTVLMQGPNPGTTPTLGKPNIPALTPFINPGSIRGSIPSRSPVLTLSLLNLLRFLRGPTHRPSGSSQ